MKLKILLFLLLSTFMIFANESNIGDTITPFSANDENGNFWNLKENLSTKYLVVYFYPVALTGG